MTDQDKFMIVEMKKVSHVRFCLNDQGILEVEIPPLENITTKYSGLLNTLETLD